MAPSKVDIEPDQITDFFVEEETPHKVLYKFWIFRAGEGWTAIGPEDTSDDRTDHWMFLPPMPIGSVFAYWLGVYGHVNSQWRVRLTISQKDATGQSSTVRDSWTESGTLNDAGHGGGVGNTDIIRVKLT